MLRALVRVLREPLPCSGHHWHVTANGWACCRCPNRVGLYADAPANEAACAETLSPLDELEQWLTDLAPPDAAPLITRRRLRQRFAR